MTTLGELWTSVLDVFGDPDPAVAAGAGIVALVAVANRGLWSVTRNAITIAHEAGHAVVALLTGRKLHGIRLHSDTSGLTLSAGRPTGPGMVATTLAGYLTPPLLGAGAAGLIAAGQLRLLLWLSIALLLAVLVVVRNFFGVVSVLATGAIVFAVSWFATAQVQAAFGHAFAWFLLLGGTRTVLELRRRRRRGLAPQSDADLLARLTGVPAAAWVLVFGAVCVGAILLGGRLMLFTSFAT
ncbi:membrane protein [Longimycelium tulufanense]|uniref:Membrane protein n=1 Tax=Longimycelium tulufanense TaxID=907463 RepID=A0A8J3FUV6_9PSEU|nr:M50 family metallopeptidase [Longimycelium tulufanense]GGM46589.1 membrane protein [Longimycelium tulufanense]